MTVEKKTRIYARNEEKLLRSARSVFATHGLKAATMDKIAELAEMSQPNVHRYFPTKNDLYLAVVNRTLDEWFEDVTSIDPAGDPATELKGYVARKLEKSRSSPESSRIFAHEILLGAPHLSKQLKGIVRDEAVEFARILRTWISSGLIRDVDPYHLIFLIWGFTQYYADFTPEVLAVLDKKRLTKADFAEAEDTICQILLAGLLLAPPGAADA